jgi:hypothetical protein
MKKLACLTLLAAAICCACTAQQSPGKPDSATDPRLPQPGDISFVHVSATIKEAHKVWLQWDVDTPIDGNYFVIERSQDSIHYETIGAILSNGGRDHYELTDQAPPNGADFYRIRYTRQNGQPLYSKTIQLSLSGEVDFKFYPNPVDKLFIVRTEHLIDLEILDASGGIRLSKRLQPGIQIINAASLEHGVYILRVTDKESNRASSSQLVKN